MKKLLIGAAAIAVLAIAPAAMANPSGSSEDHTFSCATPDEEYQPTAEECGAGQSTYTRSDTNDVRCTEGGTPVGDGGGDDSQLYANGEGVEICTEEGDVQGRAYADANGVTADGDKDNSPDTQGWVRVGPGGIVCDGDGSNDSTNPGNGGTCGS